MGNFVTEKQISDFKFYLKGIREDLGRFVTLHIPGPKLQCPNCLTDPINKRSTNVYSPRNPFPPTTTFQGVAITSPIPFTGGLCPVCNGTSLVGTETTRTYQCMIRYLKSKQKQFAIEGVETENDFRLKADISTEADFKAARTIEVDGIPVYVTVITRGGLRDLSQIIIFCKMSDWPGGKKVDVTFS